MNRRLIEEHRQRYGVKGVCQALQGVAQWLLCGAVPAPECAPHGQAVLTARIREIHAISRETLTAGDTTLRDRTILLKPDVHNPDSLDLPRRFAVDLAHGLTKVNVLEDGHA